MPGLPTLQVHLDDVDNGGTWPHDISSYVSLSEGYTLSTRGRADEDSSPAPVQLGLTLENLDGRFTLGSTSGGYGAINVDRGIRVRLTVNGVTTTRFTGFVQSWPVDWPTGTSLYARAQISAVDALARWESRTLLSIPQEEILADGPDFYYLMAEPEGSPAAYDSSGNSKAALNVTELGAGGPRPVFGTATGPGTDGLTAVSFGNTAAFYADPVVLRTTNWASTRPAWVEISFAVSSPSDLSFIANLLTWATPTRTLQIGLDAGANGQIIAHGGGQMVGGSNLLNGGVHTVAVWIDAADNATLMVDGVVVDTSVWAPYTTYDEPSLRVGYGMVGSIAHVVGGVSVAAFSGAVNARLNMHAQALLSGFGGERTDARVKRLAGYEGSAPTYTGPALGTNVPFIEISGRTVADAIQQVALAEQGVAFVDGQGRTTLHGRNASGAKVAADLVVSTNTDIVDPGISVEGDKQSMINHATGKRTAESSAEQVVLDVSSRRIHGHQGQSYEFLLFTESEVLDRLNWILATRKEPVPRIPDLVLDVLSADASVQAAVMALDVDSRIRVTSMPGQSSTGTTADLVVRGYSEQLSAEGWIWSANVESWLGLEQVWILGDSTYGLLGSTTRLGV